jgi:hypothetical protein
MRAIDAQSSNLRHPNIRLKILTIIGLRKNNGKVLC